jgi:hypothetical protein
MKGLARWLFYTVALYAPCAALSYAANIATIIAIRGLEPLTAEVLWVIFIRDALMAIPIAAIFAFVLLRVRR